MNILVPMDPGSDALGDPGTMSYDMPTTEVRHACKAASA